MPEMISLRSFRLASKTGHVVLFEANTPRFVPDAVVSDAMAAGCVPVDKADIPFYEDVTRAQVEFEGDARRSTIFLAIQAIVESNDIKEFDGGGVPKAEAVSNRLGYTVARDEVRAIFQMFMTARKENREFGLHPQAMSIMKVIQADTKQELIELAIEFGVAETRAKGLSTRDLRKLLLTKFNGRVHGE